MGDPEWHILTGEYPPQPGGVSDYTRNIARGLAEAGDRVCVWAPACPGPEPRDAGVEVRRLPGHFGPRALAYLSRHLPRPAHLLVQYVPHGLGFKSMNLLFCLWLWRRGRRDSIDLMFHEVAMPVDRAQPTVHRILGSVHRVMAWIVVRSAHRVQVSIPAWETMLRRISPRLPPVVWLPVPANISVVDDPAGVARVRARYCPPASILIGHFGTYNAAISAMLRYTLPMIVHRLPSANILLMGRGSREFAAQLAGSSERIHALGMQEAADLSRSIAACDLMVQPFADGVSSRNTSVSAALAHARPVVTTSGQFTEPFWYSSEAVRLTAASDLDALVNNVVELAQDAARRQAMAVQATALYRERFDLQTVIAALRAAA